MAELLTSLDVVNQSFNRSIRGYDPAEVDEFLDQIAETLQIYAQKTKDMERELTVKSESLSEYENMKGALHEALLLAQKSADEKVKKAEAEAEKIVAEALEKADSICHDASLEADNLREGVAQIRNIRHLYEQEFRGILAKFDNLLNQTMGSSTVNFVVESIIGPEEASEEESPQEATFVSGDAASQDSESMAIRQDLEDAFNALGVDPRSILGDQESGRGY